jgi:hypothetical protein
MGNEFEPNPAVPDYEQIFDQAAELLLWPMQQMLIAEGLDANAARELDDDDLFDILPFAPFGSDAWLKRQILAVLCPAYEDIQEIRRRAGPHWNSDPDKYVRLIIPPRHKKFFRLTHELGERLPWIAETLDPIDESSAVAVQKRLRSLGLKARVRIRYADLNEVRFVD